MIWSSEKGLLDMLELNALKFIRSVTEVRRIATILEQNASAGEELTDVEVRTLLAGTVKELMEHLTIVGAQSAWVAANRLNGRLLNMADPMSADDIKTQFRDIESRFADHLDFIRLFVIWGQDMLLLGNPSELLTEPTASRFKGVWYDCEEAAKCIVVQRPTAAVFHAMRMLEIGIKAFALRLGIEDPVKPAQRNWGHFLREIKAKIDSDYPMSGRTAGSEGAFLDSLFATLDAVKNPWRNEVMHVEGVYTDMEARHILFCTTAFIQKMASGFDEHGKAVEPELLPNPPTEK